MKSTLASCNDVQTLAHADLLMLLADLLRRPAMDWPGQQLPALLDAAGVGPTQEPAPAWRRLQQQIQETDPDVWSFEHHRLFEGAMACPPCQTAYVRRDKGAILGDLCGFYQAFHLAPPADSGEKPDHIVTQLEFLSLLLVMGASSTAAGPGADAPQQVVTDATRAFADDHMAPWLGLFAAQLRRATPLPLYDAVAEVIERTWSLLAQHHRWIALAVADSDLPSTDLDPPSDDCGHVADPLVPLQLRGAPIDTGDQIERRPVPG
ncbi:MAG: molecular chaperone TorD family protein [Phycisphaeraceae bacterium]